MWRDRPHVYFLRPVGEAGPVKIGWSVLPTERLKAYQSWSPVLLELVARTPGDETLEARLHAHFVHLHMHGEWFREAFELTAVIASVLDGSFDPRGLPEGRRLTKKVVSRESVEAGMMVRRFNALQLLDIVIPDAVRGAASTYGLPPEQVAQRRAIIREFVLAHDHFAEAAKVAASERRLRFTAGRSKPASAPHGEAAA